MYYPVLFINNTGVLDFLMYNNFRCIIVKGVPLNRMGYRLYNLFGEDNGGFVNSTLPGAGAD
jgi:hypothetical protein